MDKIINKWCKYSGPAEALIKAECGVFDAIKNDWKPQWLPVRLIEYKDSNHPDCCPHAKSLEVGILWGDIPLPEIMKPPIAVEFPKPEKTLVMIPLKSIEKIRIEGEEYFMRPDSVRGEIFSPKECRFCRSYYQCREAFGIDKNDLCSLYAAV